MERDGPGQSPETGETRSFEPSRSTVLRRGMTAECVSGGRGRLEHVILDPETRAVTDLVVRFEGKEWLIPLAATAIAAPDRLVVSGSWSDYMAEGPLDHGRFRTVKPREARLASQRRAAVEGAPLLDAGRDTVRLDAAPGGTATAAPGQPGPTAEQPRRLQLREERLRVETEAGQAARLRVSRHSVDRIVKLEVPIREERITVERIPGSGAGPLMIGGRELKEGDRVEFTLATEEVSVSKRRVPLEDFSLRKETVRRQEQVRATLRREELAVADRQHLAVQVPAPQSQGDPAGSGGQGQVAAAEAARGRGVGTGQETATR